MPDQTTGCPRQPTPGARANPLPHLAPTPPRSGLDTEILSQTAHSWLHWEQNPFNMRQLKRMPLAVSSTVDSLPAPAPAVPRLRVGKLCIAVQGATPAELFSRADAAT